MINCVTAEGDPEGLTTIFMVRDLCVLYRVQHQQMQKFIRHVQKAVEIYCLSAQVEYDLACVRYREGQP